jgi:hypothetical protein
MEEYPITELRIQLNDKIITNDKFFLLMNHLHKNPKLFIRVKKLIEKWQN